MNHDALLWDAEVQGLTPAPFDTAVYMVKFTIHHHIQYDAWCEIRNRKFEIMNRSGDPILAKFRILPRAKKGPW